VPIAQAQELADKLKQAGDSVNIENDMLVKYVEKILAVRAASPTA